MRVYSGYIQVLFIRSTPSPVKVVCFVGIVLRTGLNKDSFIHPIVYNLKFVGPLEFKLVAPMPEQLLQGVRNASVHYTGV